MRAAVSGPGPTAFDNRLMRDTFKSHLEKKRRKKGYAPGAAPEEMSTFGSPGALPTTKPTPPQRGSFPLDHDGECKKAMTSYLACMKKVRGVNQDECRNLAKAYLSCRMDRNLMARDEFKNLGFAEPALAKPPAEPEKGVKGELRW